MKPEPLFQTHGYSVYDKETATKMGYESLTVAYQTDSTNPLIRRQENFFWELQCYQMTGCDAVAVLVDNGLEMWRHTSELNIDPETGLKRATMMGTQK
jgi:hypothetical protein